MDPKKIRPYDKNAKKHPKKQVFQIAESVKRFGWQQPIVVDQEGVIIVGHGRYFAWKEYDLPEPPIQIAKLTPEEAMAYRLADNKLNESEWDMDLVLEDLRTLTDDLLELTGFNRDLLIEPEAKDDDVPEPPEEPLSKRGDLYELGNHRILCGDATSDEDMKTLMTGAKADMVFTDPPYNVDYKGSGENTKEGIMNDKMDDVAFGLFLTDSFKRMAENTKRSAGCYVFHSHKTASQFEMALEATGFIIDTQLIWNKPAAGLGMNHYRTKHEPFFYCAQDKVKEFYGDRTGTTVWKVPQDEAKQIKWLVELQKREDKGDSTVWTMSRANVAEYVHPTQKPVELPVTAMLKSSKADDVVLDQFLGSGTTLIAAQKTNRACYGLELDPKFVDVIIQRWVNFTQNEEIIRNGKPITWKMTT